MMLDPAFKKKMATSTFTYHSLHAKTLKKLPHKNALKSSKNFKCALIWLLGLQGIVVKWSDATFFHVVDYLSVCTHCRPTWLDNLSIYLYAWWALNEKCTHEYVFECNVHN